MRRFQAFLLATGLVAAPLGAAAKPSTNNNSETTMFEKTEWSSSQGRLGVLVMSLSPELRTYFGSTDNSGVLVAKVEPGSAAARAGVHVGDVIINVSEKKVGDAGDVLSALDTTSDHVKVRVLRDKKPLELNVALGAPKQSALEQGPFQWLKDLFEGAGSDSST